MAKKKISGLPAGSALNGTELVPIVQTGTTKRITTQDIANLGNSSGVDGSGTINTLAKFTASSTIGNSQIFDNGTSVGINTITPSASYKLDVNGTVRVYNDLTVYSTGLGLILKSQDNTGSYIRFSHNSAGDYAYIGDAYHLLGSPYNLTTDLAIRAEGALVLTSGGGTPRLSIATSGAATFSADATINGVTVGKGSGNIADNTAVGVNALLNNTTGSFNVAVGRVTLSANTSGDGNAALGYGALNANTTGNQNVAIGNSALIVNTTGTENTAIGSASLYSNISGSRNTAIGRLALFSNTASNNTAIGFEAANNNTSGTNNTAIGLSALRANTTGSANIAIGVDALSSNTTGNSNSVLGVNAQSGNYNESIILGRNAAATADNQFVVGSASYPAGAIATEVLVSDRSWAVRINGTAYKILLKA